jgi:hypothetical protein
MTIKNETVHLDQAQQNKKQPKLVKGTKKQQQPRPCIPSYM